MASLAATSIPAPAPASSGREGIRPPKYADRMGALDFNASPMPVISLWEPPAPVALREAHIVIRGEAYRPQTIPWADIARLGPYEQTVPFICQSFNWTEEETWTGVRLGDFLAEFGPEAEEGWYYTFRSNDGEFFEALTPDEARDPRVMLAVGLNGQELPHQHGGPIRLVVPFLQGFKSVKWLGRIEVHKQDPVGTKRLLGHTVTGRLGQAIVERFGIASAKGRLGQ